MVTVDVTALEPVMDPGWLAEHVGTSTAPAGLDVTEHASVTLPVKPLAGVTVTVEIVAPPWGIDEAELALSENDAAGVAIWMTYSAVSIMLVPMVGLMAIAEIVSDAATGIGPEYTFEAAVGVDPSVV
jgi:hypothetical protein